MNTRRSIVPTLVLRAVRARLPVQGSWPAQRRHFLIRGYERNFIACAESWDDIALYGRSKLVWLRTFLELPNGIPSHDTFRRVFMLIDPDAFEAGFATWVSSLTAGFEREVVAIDGKMAWRSFDHGRDQSALHVSHA